VTESREQFLARVAEEHYQWEGRHLESATYDPNARPDSGDANMWYLDMNATPEQEKELADRVGESSYADGDDTASDGPGASSTTE
jgi:hypothetical protein